MRFTLAEPKPTYKHVCFSLTPEVGLADLVFIERESAEREVKRREMMRSSQLSIPLPAVDFARDSSR